MRLAINIPSPSGTIYRLRRLSAWDIDEYQAVLEDIKSLHQKGNFICTNKQSLLSVQWILDRMQPYGISPPQNKGWLWEFMLTPQWWSAQTVRLFAASKFNEFDGGDIALFHNEKYPPMVSSRMPNPKVLSTGITRADILSTLFRTNLDPVSVMQNFSLQEIDAAGDRLAELCRPEKELHQEETNRRIKEVEAKLGKGGLQDWIDEQVEKQKTGGNG